MVCNYMLGGQNARRNCINLLNKMRTTAAAKKTSINEAETSQSTEVNIQREGRRKDVYVYIA